MVALGLFMMPLHPPARDLTTVLEEDRDLVKLADRLGYAEAWMGEHFTSTGEPVTSPLLFHASLAGLMVATVSVSGGWLGPVLSGLALGFPITFSAGIWVLHRDYGGDFAAATMAAMPRSMVSFLAFALTLHLLSGPLTAIHALGLALVASLVVAGGLALLVQARRPRPAA